MAEGTRLSQMEKHQKLFDDRIQDLARSNDSISTTIGSMEERIGGFEDRLKVVGAGVDELKGEMQRNFKLMLTALNKTTDYSDDARGDDVNVRHGRHVAVDLSKNFKVEFPRFDGSDPRSWTQKCDKFFNFNPMSSDCKVSLAQIYMEGKADTWFQGFQAEVGAIDWSRFTEEIIARYDIPDRDPVDEFKNLKQTTTLSVALSICSRSAPLV